MRERLKEIKPSSRLATEVALAGLGLWYLKKRLYKVSDEPNSQEPITPPVVESSAGSTLYVYPLEMDEDGRPKSVVVGCFENPEDSIVVSGELESEQAINLEENSEKDPSRLKILMDRIVEVRQKFEKTNAELFDGQ